MSAPAFSLIAPRSQWDLEEAYRRIPELRELAEIAAGMFINYAVNGHLWSGLESITSLLKNAEVHRRDGELLKASELVRNAFDEYRELRKYVVERKLSKTLAAEAYLFFLRAMFGDLPEDFEREGFGCRYPH